MFSIFWEMTPFEQQPNIHHRNKKWQNGKMPNSQSQIVTKQTWLQNFCELRRCFTPFPQRKSHPVINQCNHPATMLLSCIFFEIFMQDGSINLQTFDLMDVSMDKV